MKAKLVEVPRRALAGLTAALIVFAVMALAVFHDGDTPRPVSASAPAQQFSADRAVEHLHGFPAGPRPIGSPASDQTRGYLVDQLRAQGLAVESPHGVGARTAAGIAAFGEVDNIVATLPGTDSTGTVLIAAHYDSVATGPGISDDGAAVASMLETVRALRSQGALRNDVVLVITDGEEAGLLGADAFVRQHRLGSRGGVVLNWEARGVSGPSLMFETSEHNAGLVDLFTSSVPDPRGDSSMVSMYRVLPNSTDFTVFNENGFTGLNSAYLEGGSRYHTKGDSLAHLDRGSLQHHGENMVALTRALGVADLPSLESDHDLTYFRILGKMVSYPDSLVWPLSLIAAMGALALVATARLRGITSLPKVVLGALSALLPIAVSALLAQALWALLVFLRPAYDSMEGLVHHPLGYQAAIIALVGFSLLCWYLPLRRRLGAAALISGALVWPTVLGVVCAAFLPGASYLFALPALFGSLGCLIAVLLRRFPVGSVIAATAGPVVAALVLPGFAFAAFDAMGLASGGVGAAMMGLFGLMVLPVLDFFFPDEGISRFAAITTPLVAVTLAAVLTTVGLLHDQFTADAPGRTHLAYVLDADSGTANWVSSDLVPSPWSSEYVRTRETGALPPGYARGPLWTGSAPAISAAGPEVDVRSRDGDVLTLHVTSRRAAPEVALRVERPITEATASAPGQPPVTVPITGAQPETWPGEIRFRDVPPEGIDLTLRVPGSDITRVTAIDRTFGLTGIPGFAPRPPSWEPSTADDSETLAITRTYEL